MSRYVDGFVIPIKKSKLKEYKRLAAIGRKVWMKYGALDYYECVGAKLDNPWGMSFKKLCKLKPDETLIFAFVIYKSKAQRDSITKKMHSDPAMQGEMKMPFDMKRFTAGEFKTLLHT